jgi:hypothetical protein
MRLLRSEVFLFKAIIEYICLYKCTQGPFKNQGNRLKLIAIVDEAVAYSTQN